MLHFTQPDSVVPQPGSSQAWNRYSYVVNNPLMYSDPSGNTYYAGGYGGMEPDDPPDYPIPVPDYSPPDVCTDPVECDLEKYEENCEAYPSACKDPVEQTQENWEMANEILKNPDAPYWVKSWAAGYITILVAAVTALAVGLGGGSLWISSSL